MIKSIQVQLTTKCNQKCVMCRKYTWEPKELTLVKLISKLKQYRGATVTFSGGDPLEYSKLPALVDYLIQNKVVYQVLTNLAYELNLAQIVFLKNAKFVQVSLDGGDQLAYEKVRGIKSGFYTMVTNCGMFRNIKFNCTVSRINSTEVKHISHLAARLGFPVRFWPVHTHDALKLSMGDKHYIGCLIRNLNKECPEVYGNTNLSDFEALLQRKPAPQCFVKQHHIVIDEAGIEYPCCRAINDNGVDIGKVNSVDNLERVENPHQLYDFCSECDRYVRFNLDWDVYKDKEDLFL